MKFYTFERVEFESAWDVEYEADDPAVYSEEATKCPKCGAYVGMLEWLPPRKLRIVVRGHGYPDIAQGAGTDFIVSERFKYEFEETDLIGLSDFGETEIVHVENRRKSAEEVPRYYNVVPLHTHAAIDVRASGLEWRRPPTCMECFTGRGLLRYSRIVVDPSSWSGEDIFIARGLSQCILSERFRSFCLKNGFRTPPIIPACQAHRDFLPSVKGMGL